MKYFDIKNQLDKLIVFSLRDILFIDESFRENTLYDWEKVGKVVRLRNNKYIFSDFKVENGDYYLLSNRLYEPSYVSLELALNHYGVIPEAVAIITAISTNKTKMFETPVGVFNYQSINSELFFGYNLIEQRQRGVKLASLEKAVLDYVYLHPEVISLEDFSGLRWNKDVLSLEMSFKTLDKYCKIFSNQALSSRVETLKEYIDDRY